MSRQPLAWAAIAAVALIAGIGAAVWQLPASDAETMAQLPFDLVDAQGQAHHADATLGSVVVLNFWAPWCGPCREEIPILNQLQQALGSQGLRILGMTVDEADSAQRFTQAVPIHYPVLLGLEPILMLQSQYGETRLPYSVIIDRDGQVRHREVGVLSEPEWRARLQPLLNENRAD